MSVAGGEARATGRDTSSAEQMKDTVEAEKGSPVAEKGNSAAVVPGNWAEL